MASDTEMRKLADLRVVDLKNELEKRGLETSGIKSVLFDRLLKALEEEGHDSKEFIFEVSKVTPIKKAKDSEKEESVTVKKSTDLQKDMNVKETENEKGNEKEETAKPVEEDATLKESANNIKGENVDNEDSLNLTIGEEDEKLFSEDVAETKVKEPDVTNQTENMNESAQSKDEGGTEAEKNADENKESSAPNLSTVNKTSSTSSSQGKNLWVSGLSQQTRATDLKQLFSKYGKVIGAKVVTNTRTPGTRCYGYVTMASVKDTTECIEHLHRTELHGRLISVERAKSDLGPPKPSSDADNQRRSRDRSSRRSDRERTRDQNGKDRKEVVAKKPEKAKVDAKSGSKTEEKAKVEEKKDSGVKGAEQTDEKKTKTEEKPAKAEESKKGKESKTKTDSKTNKETKVSSSDTEKQNRRSKSGEILSFEKIREERERQRLRQKERELREEERRRRETARRQREEERRLSREREKLALERARIEKEKVELLRLERERQKLERERIELERLELKRQQRKIEEAKRAIKRPSDDHYDNADRKRSVSDRRFEPPPPPRFDSSISSSKYTYDRSGDKKRIEEYSSKREEYRDSSKGYERSTNTLGYKDGRSSRDERPHKSRYESYDRGNGSSIVWNHAQPASTFNATPSTVAMADTNTWRNDSGPDRYDRYNLERKIGTQPVGYVDSSRQQFSSSGSSQDRFARNFEGRRY